MELLIELSTIGISGIVVSYGLDELRRHVNTETWYGRLLYTPRYARWLVLFASAALASISAYAAQALGGPSADPAVASAWAAVTSQAVHAVRHLPTEPTCGEGQ